MVTLFFRSHMRASHSPCSPVCASCAQWTPAFGWAVSGGSRKSAKLSIHCVHVHEQTKKKAITLLIRHTRTKMNLSHALCLGRSLFLATQRRFFHFALVNAPPKSQLGKWKNKKEQFLWWSDDSVDFHFELRKFPHLRHHTQAYGATRNRECVIKHIYIYMSVCVILWPLSMVRTLAYCFHASPRQWYIPFQRAKDKKRNRLKK